MSSQDFQSPNSGQLSMSSPIGCFYNEITPEVTFCFKNLRLGYQTLGLQRSWMVETGSHSPLAFASTVVGPGSPQSICLLSNGSLDLL